MPGTIIDAQTTLNYLYAIRTAALVALANPQADIVSYEIGDRKVNIRSYNDLKPLEEMIRYYESIVTADVVVLPNMSGISNPPAFIQADMGTNTG
jgi:hypothetical protein